MAYSELSEVCCGSTISTGFRSNSEGRQAVYVWKPGNGIAHLLSSTALGLVERPDFLGAFGTFSASVNMLYSRTLRTRMNHEKCMEQRYTVGFPGVVNTLVAGESVVIDTASLIPVWQYTRLG